MSRIGKKPVEIPAGVEVKLTGNSLHVKGPKGELSKSFTRRWRYARRGHRSWWRGLPTTGWTVRSTG